MKKIAMLAPLMALATWGCGSDLIEAPFVSLNPTTSPSPSPTTPPGTNFVALSQTGELLAFNSNNPSSVTSLTITGVEVGDQLVGLDVRPQNHQLYALGVNTALNSLRLYSISEKGVASPIGAGPVTFLTAASTVVPIGSSFGFDFNPAFDRVRIVSNSGLNCRLNPNTGAAIDGSGDPNINPDGPVSGGTTTLDGTAYTNAVQSTLVTTQYTIDSQTNSLFIQNPPNSGTQNTALPVTLNGSNLDFDAGSGFDIPAGVDAPLNNAAVNSGSGFASLTVGGVQGLYQINLVNGQATLLGAIGSGNAGIRGLAALPSRTSVPMVGLTPGGNLERFMSGTPTTTSSVGTSGVNAGESLVGIDYRPATGQLYGLGMNAGTDSGTLYLIDPQSGVCTAVGANGQIAAGVGAIPGGTDLPAAGDYGFAFNPQVDRIRVTTGTGLNFRLNPNSGATAAFDTFLNGLPGGSTGLNAAEYTNKVAGVTDTTLLAADSGSDSLFSVNPPNNGTATLQRVFQINGSPVDLTGPLDLITLRELVSTGSGNYPTSGSCFLMGTRAGTNRLFRLDFGGTAAALTELSSLANYLSLAGR